MRKLAKFNRESRIARCVDEAVTLTRRGCRDVGTGRQIQKAFAVLALMFGLVSAQVASAQNPSDRQSLDDAWWTGPMLAPSAATLPQGHFLIEPYLYDVIQQGQYDRNGVKRRAPESNGFGSLTYINYGLVDKLTIGLIPTFGYNRVSDGAEQLERRDGRRDGAGPVPADKISRRQLDSNDVARCAGNFSVRQVRSAGKSAEQWAWKRRLHHDARVLLANIFLAAESADIAHALERIAIDFERRECEGRERLRNRCEFHGQAKPGGTSFVDASWEYSLTRSWVLALDATYRYQNSTRVTGFDGLSSPGMKNSAKIRFDTGYNDAIGFAPAIEYSWNSKVGILLGARVIPIGRNTAATITPAIAINIVR